MANLLTVLICTHNQADLLERVLASPNAARRPAMTVHILVAADACTDDTIARMQAYQARQDKESWLPLRLIKVPTPGKSHALNRAIPEIDTELTAFVDDDHRVNENHLIAIKQAARTWPDAGLYCGRILLGWDGSEPVTKIMVTDPNGTTLSRMDGFCALFVAKPNWAHWRKPVFGIARQYWAPAFA